MAAIDKIYINSIEQYRDYKKWCNSISYQKDSIGNLWHPIEFMYCNSDTECELWINNAKTKDAPLCNNPVYVDVFLIRNCPLEFIQNRLKEQYGEEYDQILNHTSIYDTYTVQPSSKFKILKKPNFNYRINEYWGVEVYSDNMFWGYNSIKNCWKTHLDLCYMDDAYAYFKHIDSRKIKRLIKKWKLPKGVIVSFLGKYEGQFYKIITC